MSPIFLHTLWLTFRAHMYMRMRFSSAAPLHKCSYSFICQKRQVSQELTCSTGWFHVWNGFSGWHVGWHVTHPSPAHQRCVQHCQMDRLPMAPCLGIAFSRINTYMHTNMAFICTQALRSVRANRRGNTNGRSLENATLVRPSLVGVYNIGAYMYVCVKALQLHRCIYRWTLVLLSFVNLRLCVVVEMKAHPFATLYSLLNDILICCCCHSGVVGIRS